MWVCAHLSAAAGTIQKRVSEAAELESQAAVNQTGMGAREANSGLLKEQRVL